MLFEDAFMIRDRATLVQLFEDGAVLVAADRTPEARGGDQIGRFAAAMWNDERTYVAAPRRVFQARDTALVVAERSINVMHRRSNGEWRYAISLLSLGNMTAGKET